MSFKSFVLFLVLSVALVTRFVGLNWGNGNYFHPDENNMAIAVSRLTTTNLNPQFFAYGQFPLYLGFFTLKILSLPNTFPHAVLILRVWSAVFSMLAILTVFLISRKLFSKKFSLIAVLLTIFNPGLIQLAHFGTTESLLILIFLLNIFLSLKIYQQPKKYSFYILAGIVSGLGLATKISSLIFLGPILLVSAMNFIRSPNRLTFIPKMFLLLIFTAMLYIISSPYNLLDRKDFFSTMAYETGVATGQTKVFYTTQFFQTIPYLFQTTHIFPYVSGIFQFIFAIIGLVILIRNWQLEKRNYLYWFLILVPSLVYFLYFGQLYCKWTRFVSPLFFLFPLLSVVLISVVKNKLWQYFLIFLGCLPGLYFFTNLYFHPDIRFTASQWLNQILPANAKVLSEGGNVVDFPVAGRSFNIVNYDFYQYHPESLAAEITKADYILVPSRRVFKNYNYPYYRHLFDGSLGFKEIKIFSLNPDVLLNSETAEETWSVFDHPVVRVYQKVHALTNDQYLSLLKP
jgi:hypothetical protein